MMELLVSHGADVNALWHGHFPIIFAPCESMDAAALKWLLDHGASPNRRDHGYQISGHGYPGTALDYLISSYARSMERLSACVDVLLEAGGETRFDTPGLLAVLRGRLDHLEELIDGDPGLPGKRFSELDCGQSGGRSLLLQGGTLLHVAAEYGNTAACGLLLDSGANVNARATTDAAGVGGQTPIFHAVTQFDDGGLPVTELLLERGADLAVRVKLPGDYERPGRSSSARPWDMRRCLAAALRGGPSS